MEWQVTRAELWLRPPPPLLPVQRVCLSLSRLHLFQAASEKRAGPVGEGGRRLRAGDEPAVAKRLLQPPQLGLTSSAGVPHGKSAHEAKAARLPCALQPPLGRPERSQCYCPPCERRRRDAQQRRRAGCAGNGRGGGSGGKGWKARRQQQQPQQRRRKPSWASGGGGIRRRSGWTCGREPAEGAA